MSNRRENLVSIPGKIFRAKAQRLQSATEFLKGSFFALCAFAGEIFLLQRGLVGTVAAAVAAAVATALEVTSGEDHRAGFGVVVFAFGD